MKPDASLEKSERCVDQTGTNPSGGFFEFDDRKMLSILLLAAQPREHVTATWAREMTWIMADLIYLGQDFGSGMSWKGSDLFMDGLSGTSGN